MTTYKVTRPFDGQGRHFERGDIFVDEGQPLISKLVSQRFLTPMAEGPVAETASEPLPLKRGPGRPKTKED